MVEMPDWEVRLWGEYLSKEPAPEEKLEYALAYLTARTVQCHTGKSRKLNEYLLFRDPWAVRFEDVMKPSGNSDVDDDIALMMAAFASRLVIQHRE